MQLRVLELKVMLPGHHERGRGQVHLVQDQHQGQPELSSHILIKCWGEVHNLEHNRSEDRMKRDP